MRKWQIAASGGKRWRVIVRSRACVVAIAAVMAGSMHEAGAQEASDPGKLYRYGLSCAAYAQLKTGECPEALKVHERGIAASSASEQQRADEGLIWTNRAYFGGVFAAEQLEKETGQMMTNGEISQAQQEWVNELIDAPETGRIAIRDNCQWLFERADEYCAETRCVGAEK